MAVTATLSNHFKYQAYHKKLDLASGGDTIKAILMRNGFTFDKDVHGKYKNVMGTITAADISFENGSKHVHTAAGDFQAAGFVAGGKILVSGSTSNNTTYTIASVDTALQMTLSEAPVEETAGQTITITGADELATGNGYTRATKAISGQALTEDEANDRAEFTCDSVVWTASGGSIGPTPSCILYDDTDTDKAIIGCIDFGGNQTAGDGSTFTVSAIKVRLS